jgi:hypothetical protein
MIRDDLFKGLSRPTNAVRQLPIYHCDGRFRLIVNELIDPQRADALSRDDLYLYIGYLFNVIADLHHDGGSYEIH